MIGLHHNVNNLPQSHGPALQALVDPTVEPQEKGKTSSTEMNKDGQY